MLTTYETARSSLDGATDADRAEVERLIRAASARIETYLGRVLGRMEHTEHRALSRAGRYLLLRNWPIRTVTAIRWGGSIVPVEEAQRYRGGLLARRGQDWSAGEYEVTYTAGYILPVDSNSDLPPDIEDATILAVRYAWADRGRDPTLKAIEIPEVERREFWVGAIGNGALPPDVLQRLAPHRAPSL
jgi:hypothetical protein